MISGYLKDGCFLKNLEEQYIYDTDTDNLYLLDGEAFDRIVSMHAEDIEDAEAVKILREAGLWQRQPRKLPFMIEGRSSNPSLRYLEIQITDRCDKSCRHCYLGPPGNRDMEEKTFEDVLDQFTTNQGLKVMVSGGEPACHPQFFSMMESLMSRPLHTILMTHGEWIGRENASWTAERFHQVQVSLDGLETGHDTLRGRGSFKKAVAGIRALREAGVSVSVGTMVHKGNCDEFDGMSELLKELEIGEWSIDVPCRAGRWKRTSSDPVILADMSKKLRYAYGGGFHGGAGGFSCGLHLMTVAPDGSAAKCGFYFDNPAGNVREGLAEVWGRIDHIPIKRLDCDCDQIDACAGGCRFRAKSAEGSDLAVDVVQCYARGVK